jgi:hypothetical protein
MPDKFVRSPQRPVPEAFQHLYSEEHKQRRRRALAECGDGAWGVELEPKTPSGHAYAIALSTRLTSDYRQTHKRESMNITPQQLIDVLVAADVKGWVLMGLHGYAGYLPEPRATQDVDVMVPYSQKKRAVKAIREAWPKLEVRELSHVVRFLDPGDRDGEDQAKPVVDLMLPWSTFQETILRDHVVVDDVTMHRLPTLEAAVIWKYAAMVSAHRAPEKRDYDAGDFRRIVRTNHNQLDRDVLRRLGNEVWSGGGEEVLEFIQIAVQDRPFPI